MGLGLLKYYDFGGVGQLAGAVAGASATGWTAPEAPAAPQTLRDDLNTLDTARANKGLTGPMTSDDVKAAFTNSENELVHSDGTKLQEGELDMLTELANKTPQERTEFLTQYTADYKELAKDYKEDAKRYEAVNRAAAQAGQAAGGALTASNANERREEDTDDIVAKADRRWFARPH